MDLAGFLRVPRLKNVVGKSTTRQLVKISNYRTIGVVIMLFEAQVHDVEGDQQGIREAKEQDYNETFQIERGVVPSIP